MRAIFNGKAGNIFELLAYKNLMDGRTDRNTTQSQSNFAPGFINVVEKILTLRIEVTALGKQLCPQCHVTRE